MKGGLGHVSMSSGGNKILVTLFAKLKASTGFTKDTLYHSIVESHRGVFK